MKKRKSTNRPRSAIQTDTKAAAQDHTQLAAHSTLNTAIFESLRVMSDEIDPTLLEDLIEAFRDDAPMRIKGIKDALKRDDLSEIRHHAHCFRGSLNSFGVDRLAFVMAAIERAAEDGDRASVEWLITSLDTEFKKVRSRLKA